MARRWIAVALVVGQLTLFLTSCASVRTIGSQPIAGKGGGVAVEVYKDDSARRGRQPGPAGLVGELQRRDGGDWVPVFRSLNPTWAVTGLPPGKYRVRFPARLDDSGNVVRLNPHDTKVDVTDGRMTQVQAVLDHVSPALVAVGVVAVVVLAVVIADYLSDHDLPAPPLPPPELAQAVFQIGIDIAFEAAMFHAASDHVPPRVTSTFPAPGAIVAARRPRVIFSLTKRPDDVKPRGISVLGEQSGLIDGQVSYESANWWLVWTPLQDLEPGDTFHVTLGADAIQDAAGNELAKPVTFAFRTAR